MKRSVCILSIFLQTFVILVLHGNQGINQNVSKDFPGKGGLKQTTGGKAIAPVVDIQPYLRGFHDYERVREEIHLLRKLGFERVYFVLCQPGYPAFSDPNISIMPPNKGTGNNTLESILALGDPNWVYMYEAQRQGMEAWAILKPYESGTGFTIPHGASAPLSRSHVETIGGQHIHFDNLLSDNPELRIKRKPAPDSIIKRLNEPVESVEIAFCLDSFKQTTRQGYFEFEGLEDSKLTIPEIKLWISRDNGRYVKYEGNYEVTSKIDYRLARDANCFLLGDVPKRFLVMTIKGINLPQEFRYMAITLEEYRNFYSIPYSMIKAFTAKGEIPVTTGHHVRTSISPVERIKPSEEREWGLESRPVTGPRAAESFMDWGFEFEFQGTGHWGDGWVSSPVFGIGIGKRQYMAGTPCEAYPEVQDYWLEQVRRIMTMGYDGIDFRLQYHSGNVTDYIDFGYNEPLIQRYKEKHGVDILKEEADPMEIMRIRGEYFHLFLDRAAEIIHSHNKKVKIHLRHAHEEPLLDGNFNELGFWAMPKILLDWKRAVDLADEVTIKHYYHNNYRPWMADSIKNYAHKSGKRIWVHCYISQGGELNDNFFDAVEADERIGGILLYEVESLINVGWAHSHKASEPVGGYIDENVNRLRLLMERLEYK